jgi:hypothetical protein
MARLDPSRLRSQFLLDVREQFALGLHGPMRDAVDFDEEQNDSVLRELLEVVATRTRGHGLFVRQTLVLWGDQVATYTVRENVKKRAGKLLHQVGEFPLGAIPKQIVETFVSAWHALRGLRVPPGEAPEDRALLLRIEQRWLELSDRHAH